MTAYTGPNQVRAVGRTLRFNQPQLIQPSLQLQPKQLQRFVTGSVPVIMPRPALRNSPGTPGQDDPPPLVQRGQ